MYVIDVIPFSRTAPGVLSYRSKKDLPVGSIVSIPLRRTTTHGIVIDSVPVTAAKEMLKHARFLLSRSVPSPSGMLPEAFLRAAERTATYHATTVGAVLTALFSEQIRAGVELPVSPLRSGRGYSRVVCELPLPERAAAYKKHIHECGVMNRNAMLIAPTLPELSYWKEIFKEFKPLVLSGALTGAKRAKALTNVTNHEGLIIATPSFAWIPVQKLGCIIIDRVSAGTYTLPKRPYLSVPYALESLAQERKLPLIIGDFPLPFEYRDHDAQLSAAHLSLVRIVDARRPKDEPDTRNEPWVALPAATIESIRSEIEAGGRAIILAARKGYAPSVLCRDCGQAQTDERGQAYSFSLAGGRRVFRTSDGQTVDAKRACQRCGSWNLLPLGIGIERVEEEMRARFPDTTISTIPPELLTSVRKARAAMQEAQRSGSIVIGTEAVLPWLVVSRQPNARAPMGVIASADSLLSQPFWRARERFVRLAYFLNSVCREVILVTRHPDDTAVETAAHPDSKTFWHEERSLRQALQYPPFGTIITLSIDGSQAKSTLESRRIAEGLAEYAPTPLPPTIVQGTTWRTTLVLHLTDGAWPDERLSRHIQSLPPYVRVRIDPESIWQ